MAETTGIEWADGTWNPWMGCNKVSPGCAHCYAERWVEKRLRRPFTEVRLSMTPTAPLGWARKDSFRKLGRRPRIFTCSLSDFFHPAADAYRGRAWDVIRMTPQFDYLVLTKRPERILDNLPLDWGTNGYPNVWLGTSVETQEYRGRVALLLTAPAPVHFVSCEPLLGPLDLTPFMDRVDWLIVGGESGPHARKMDADWARALRDKALEFDVAFFFKQWGGGASKGDHAAAVLDGRRWTEWPDAPVVQPPAKRGLLQVTFDLIARQQQESP